MIGMEIDRFGPFTINVRRGVLLRQGSPIVVNQRGLAILGELAAAKGEAVSKSRLLVRAWPDVVVEENNLTVQISALRKSLGKTDAGEDWIVTVPRFGYRLALPDTAAPSSASEPEKPRLAVLPFTEVKGDPDASYFADGVVGDIITALSRFKSFAVVARSASFHLRGASAQEASSRLQVRYVLQGSVQRERDRLRIAAELVDGDDGRQLWARRYDGSAEQIFDFQDRITEDVVAVVEPNIQRAEILRSRTERPGSIAVYDIYLQALALLSSESEQDNAAAFMLLQKGLALAPDNALILAHAVWAIEHRTTMGWPALTADDVGLCVEFIHRALRHADGDAIVISHCGIALLQTVKDYRWGMSVIQSAVEANPNNPMVVVRAGVAHLHCGSLHQALDLFRRSSLLSPGDPGAHFALSGMGHAHLVLGNFEEAIVYAGRALASNPNFDPALWVLIAANAHLGRLDEARHFLGRLRKLSPAVTLRSIEAGQPALQRSRVEKLLEGLRLAGLQ
jgi:TolB-like protein/Tfp pilus assembly protein PilF